MTMLLQAAMAGFWMVTGWSLHHVWCHITSNKRKGDKSPDAMIMALRVENARLRNDLKQKLSIIDRLQKRPGCSAGGSGMA